MTKNLNKSLSVELICSAQGIEFRRPLQTSVPLQYVLERLRQDVATLENDRYMAPDLESAQELVSSTKIIDAAKIGLPGLAA